VDGAHHRKLYLKSVIFSELAAISAHYKLSDVQFAWVKRQTIGFTSIHTLYSAENIIMYYTYERVVRGGRGPYTTPNC
jgi:hypothetical protein